MLNKRRIKESFSRAATTYDRASSLQKETARLLASEFKEAAGSARKILDIGSGTGHLTGALREVMAGAVYYHSDIARPMLVRARENFYGHRGEAAEGGENKNFVCADAEALPFRGEAFDALVSNLAFQWVPDTARAFREAALVLRPGGVFAFTTLGPATLNELRASLIDAKTERNPAARLRLVPFAEEDELLTGIRKAGLAPMKVEARIMEKRYESPVELLRTLKYIGALDRGEVCSATSLVKGSLLRRAFSTYERDYSSFEGVKATYEVIFVAAKKAC
ncbi:MAG: methyltransferase domain-containing protein [Thermodesulfobacteriota bacterium]